MKTKQIKRKLDFSNIKGQWYVKRAIEVAVTGEHGILFIGSPKSAKDELMACISTITNLPLFKASNICEKVGVEELLFALEHFWELPEQKDWAHLRNRDSFIFAGTMNPCPCGNLTDHKRKCECTPSQIQRYLSRLTPELMRYIDMQVEVGVGQFAGKFRKGESSDIIKKRINSAIKRPRPEDLTKEAEDILKSAILELGISAKGYDKTIKIATTIAQLNNHKYIMEDDISESIGYRCLDRNLW